MNALNTTAEPRGRDPPGITKSEGPHLTSSYRNQTKKMLKKHFPRISCSAIDAVLRSSKHNFTDAFHVLSNIESQRLGINGNGAGKFVAEIPPDIKVFLKYDRNENFSVLRLDNEILIKEIDAIPELNTKASKPPPIDLTASTSSEEEDSNGATDEKIGVSFIECLCCYGDFPRSEIRECESGSGHYVCNQCIYHYVSEQLDGNGSVAFKCIVNAECQNTYSLALLDTVLSPKLNKRVNDKVIREEMKKAGINSW